MMDRILQRAFAAFFRHGGTEQPSASDSGVEKHEGLHYAVLRNVRGTLAVYRVRNDKMLKRLKRWPNDLNR
jgi:hypothetical protein